ncbi:MAG: PDZ domain-containing protein, partial [Gammaproteobacteria bacterium]|nr:PDZ domain-containing protein [Gammaproteobacteria bacterium]
PRRLTWHPGPDVPTGWTADGSAVTLVSPRETDHGRSGQWYHASLDGGLPKKLMEARIYRGVLDAEDRRLAYIAFGSGYNGLFGGTSGWKGYRGGTTPAIQIMDLDEQTVAVVPGAGATNFNPIWLDGQLYFISDRDDKHFNIFRFDPSRGEITRITDETEWDVRSAGGHGTTIVYETSGRLMERDLATGATSEIVISINPDLPQLRAQWKDASKSIQYADISPSGKRAIVTARGEIFTVPVDEGTTRNVSNTAGQREYTAIWSPGGDEIAYIAESLDGQQLVVKDQTGQGKKRSFVLGPNFYQLMAWSNGKDPRIIFQDNHLSLFAIELANGDITKIATGVRRDQIDAALSPDGNWLAYTIEQANFHRDLELLNFATGETVTVTDGAADASAPAFSRDGEILYFAASTNSGPLQVGLNMTSQERPYRAGIYAVVLAADGKSPLSPESGDENDEEEERDKGEEDSDVDEVVPETRVDSDGLPARVVALPVAERNYRTLAVANDGSLYFVQSVQPGSSNEPPGDNAADQHALIRFDFEEKEATEVVSGVVDFSISSDGKYMIIAKDDESLAVAEIAEEFKPEALKLGGMRIRVDPREEWAQIFDEAWRMEKDFFYDPGMHGLDWQAVYDRYRPLVEHVGRRKDLSDLLVEMIAEMQVGHNRTGGGDTHREEGANTGLLGANFRINNGRYQLTRVYSGETWNPFVGAPLATPGNVAREGEYILAINGRDLSANDNIFEFLQGTAGNQLTLTVGAQASGRNTRDIVVEPVDSEEMMRLWNWIEKNRQRVSDATEGRVGYVYLPNTAGAGFTFFNRMFFAQVDKEAMIIDERSNGGGQAANYITDVLSRSHLSGWKDRDGRIFNTPAGAVHGPKVMLIDQDAGSGGDYLPYAFRHLRIGKLIGTRTWGGLIGIFANPLLIDGGVVTVPFFRFFDTERNWTVENQGVAPDIEVSLDPIASNAGRDTQLEAAIREMLSQLETYESSIPKEAPVYPTELGQ